MTDLIHLSLLKTQESARLDWRYLAKRKRKSTPAWNRYRDATTAVLRYEIGT